LSVYILAPGAVERNADNPVTFPRKTDVLKEVDRRIEAIEGSERKEGGFYRKTKNL
jgi:hypothetical protein